MKTLWPPTFIPIEELEQQLSLKDHHLHGLIYPLKKEWKKQWIHNELKLQELRLLAPKFQQHQIKITLLKGIDLLFRLYQDHGSRFLCDIDLLTTTDALPQITKILKANGYQPVKEIHWWGNLHKVTFSKQINGTEIVIELHTKLFYHISTVPLELEDSSLPPFKQLATELLFVQLAGHLAFQHTFSKLYWLIDLYLLAQRHTVDWNKVHKIAKQLQLQQSTKQVIWILNQYFATRIPQSLSTKELYLWPKIFTKEFIITPQQSPWRYQLIKHITKDSIWTAIKYDLLWMVQRLFYKAK